MLINLASQYAPWLPDRLFADGQQGLWYVTQPVYRGEQVLFQDAAGTTPVVDDGDPVGLRLDLSGNGNHASQSTSADRPIYHTDGVRHWLEYNGVNQVLIASNVGIGTADFFMVAGLKSQPDTSGPGFPTVLSVGETSSGQWMFRAINNGSSPSFFGDDSSVLTIASALGVDTRFVNEASRSGAALTASGHSASSTVSSTDNTAGADLNSALDLVIGGAHNGTDFVSIRFWKGPEYGIVFVVGDTTEGIRTRTVDYMKGLTL